MQGKRYEKRETSSILRGVVAAIVFAGSSVFAADVLFKGPGNDLADTSNWSQSSWTSDDTLIIASNNFEVSETGLTLSRDLPPSKKLQIGTMPDRTVPIDFGGHALNTELVFTKMHGDSGRFNPILASGGWTAVSNISCAAVNNMNLHLTNGVFYTGRGLHFKNGWNNYFHVLKGATFAITNVSAMLYPWESTQQPIIDIDGGTMRISGPRNDTQWRLLVYDAGSAGGNCVFKIRNGGSYIDDTVAHEDMFTGSKLSILMDGGNYIATNTVNSSRNLIFTGSIFAATNSIIRIAQFYTGQYSKGDFKFNNSYDNKGLNARYTFHNSEETFGFPARGYGLGAGFVFSPKTTNSVLRLSGGSNAWRSDCLMLNGLANRVEIEGGTFNVTNILRVADGSNCRVDFASGTSTIAKMAVTSTATNFAMRVADGASVSIAGEFSTDGTNACVTFSGQSPSLSAGKFSLGGTATLRFALSSTGYAAAPLTSDDSSMGCSVGDGTVFEFDMSGFDWPKRKKRIPLLHDAAGFSAGIDIAKLNEINAERMPSNKLGRKCSLELADNGKTLALAVPGLNGIVIDFK